jgi:hypothetical protein
MKGIELRIIDDGSVQDGKLAIKCLEHDKTHIGADLFCCNDVMVRAITLAIKQVPDGYHARSNTMPTKPRDLADWLFEIATGPLQLSLATKGDPPIEN